MISNHNSKPIVISIAAVSGGGKTTMVQALLTKLSNSKALYFDHYDFEGPDDICEWIENGGNVNEWVLTPLVKDLQLLLSLSDQQQKVDYILLDYPFSYLHDELRHLIDYTIFLDTPLDVAMVRRMMRDYTNQSTDIILSDVHHYLSHGRAAYIHMLETVKPNSDFIIDNCQPVNETVQILVEQIVKKMGLISKNCL